MSRLSRAAKSDGTDSLEKDLQKAVINASVQNCMLEKVKNGNRLPHGHVKKIVDSLHAKGYKAITRDTINNGIRKAEAEARKLLSMPAPSLAPVPMQVVTAARVSLSPLTTSVISHRSSYGTC